jgi:hypothetical protein
MLSNITKLTEQNGKVYAIAGNKVLVWNKKKWEVHDKYKAKILDIMGVGNKLWISIDEPWYEKLLNYGRWLKYKNVKWIE